MPQSRVCWMCKRLTHMSMPGETVAYSSNRFGSLGGAGTLVGALFTCDFCQVPSVGMYVFEGRVGDRDWRSSLLGVEDIVWLPQSAVGKNFPDVPEQIASAASEVHECCSIGAYRAAVLLARSVVEATAKEQGVASGSLRDKIDKLAEEGKIRRLVADAAHTLREFGNEMAHGDFVQPIEQADAFGALELVDMILTEVYQEPAQILAVKERRVRMPEGAEPLPLPPPEIRPRPDPSQGAKQNL